MPLDDVQDEPTTGPGSEGWDPARAMATINKLRGQEREYRGYKQAVLLMAKSMGLPESVLTQAFGAETPPATPPATNDLAAIAKVLGADGSDPAAVLAAARKHRIGADVAAAVYNANVYPGLARAVLASEGLLDNLDPTAEDLGDQLAAILDDVAQRHPQIKRNTPPMGGVPFRGGAGQDGAAVVTQDMLKHMSPEQINRARQSGALAHLGAGPDRD
jgi:hypothetical protein